MADIELFIYDLAFQQHLNAMDQSQRNRLADYTKKKVATKDQEKWKPDADLPDPTDPKYAITNDDDWQSLYTLFQAPLYELDSGKKGTESYHNDVNKLLEDFYGTGKAIVPFEVSPIVTSILSGPTLTNFANYLTQIRAFLEANDIPSSETDKLISKLNDGSYIHDKKALRILSAVCARIINDYGALSASTATTPPLSINDLNEIYENSTNSRPITTAELDAFKANYQDLVKRLITKKEAFAAFAGKDDDRTISYSINQALKRSDYDDPNSKNYLPPKYDDRKRLLDRAKDKVKKWKDDVFGRWTARHKRHIYSTNASYIVGEIIKNKIKPTDGLAKILENKDKIKSALAPKAKDDFKYFTDVLEKLSKTKAFAEATKDGDQMRYIVQEIIIDAIHNGKEKEAKTALETLAMVRYGASTSSIRDNLKKANSEMSIFSDKSLSFNNNGFMRGLTTAIDKTMQATVRAGFETANFLKNKLVRQKGVKFKNGTNRIKQAAKSIDYRNPANKAKFEELFAFWDFVNSSISKDYNPFMKHSAIQKKNTKDIVVGGATTRLIDQKFEDFYRTHNIGR